jgi:dipeptidyl aminopeptidase/acylaminoacyl peptidase
MGASYGGYAALWGGATQPDLYRCVISVSGIGDLPDLMSHTRRETGADSDTYAYWLRSIGDPAADRDRLEATSPIRKVEGWRPPVLLIHGEQDELVPIRQSRDMEGALRRAGVDVRLIEFEDEGHSGWSSRAEAEALREIETFLARHLPVTP